LDRITVKDRKARDVEALINHFKTDPSLASRSFHSEMLEYWVYPRCAMWFLHIFYPNDDVGYLAFGGESMWGDEEKEDVSPALFLLALVLICLGPSLTFSLVIQHGSRLLTIRALGWFLGLQPNPVYQDYERDLFNPKRQLLAYVIVLPLSCVLA